MKKIISIAFSFVLLMSCGGPANDGDARTDTTTMPMDTSIGQSSTGTMNSNTGTYAIDSTPGRGDDSISPTNPQSRRTTPGNDTNRQKQQQRQQ